MELVAKKLIKKYKKEIALNDFSFSFSKGVYGLLGENGAGKSTLIRMLCGLQAPNDGEILFDNKEISSMGEMYSEKLGYVPQKVGYYPDFTGYKYMMYLSLLKGLSEEEGKLQTLELLDKVGLEEAKDKKIRHYSGGMKQRLGIAQALINNPEILILDEPTAGLDPNERIYFKNLISLYSMNKIVILATHIVSDIEDIANEILILKKGNLIQSGNIDKIMDNVRGKVWECHVNEEEAMNIRKNFKTSVMKAKNEEIVLRVVSENKPYENSENVTENLEDVYIMFFEGRR